jgi:hypothetical protein
MAKAKTTKNTTQTATTVAPEGATVQVPAAEWNATLARLGVLERKTDALHAYATGKIGDAEVETALAAAASVPE